MFTDRKTQALALACAFALGCGDPAPVTPTDAQTTLDAGADDAGCGPIDLAPRVVTKSSHTPLADVRVRVATASAWEEGSTGADGVAHLMISRCAGPWDLTVAREGYDAVSVMGLTGPIQGDVRIDPLPSLTALQTAAIAGTVRGLRDPHDTVLVDAFAFATATARGGAYATSYQFPDDLPLELTAIELDLNGAAVNAVRLPTIARSGAPIAMADVAMPTPAATLVRATMTVRLPTSGLVTATQTLSNPPQVVQVLPGDASDIVLVGVATVAPTVGNDVPVLLQTFGGALAPSVVAVGFQDVPRSHLNVVGHEFAGDSTVAVGEVRALSVEGARLADVNVTADATDYDTVALTVSAADRGSPSWRCYAATGAPVTGLHLPDLPTGISPASIGLTGTQSRALGLLIKMHAGEAPWSIEASDGSIEDYDFTVGTPPATLRNAWRTDAADAGP